MVLDRAADYKMVSIMRQKRTIVTDPYQISDANILSQIDEEQNTRWTAALPKFGKDDYLHSEESKEKVNENQEEEKKDEEATEIKAHTDGHALRSKLMQRLSLNRIMDPTGYRPKTYQSIIIWDWDDTLMASTFLSPYQSRILEPSVR